MTLTYILHSSGCHNFSWHSSFLCISDCCDYPTLHSNRLYHTLQDTLWSCVLDLHCYSSDSQNNMLKSSILASGIAGFLKPCIVMSLPYSSRSSLIQWPWPTLHAPVTVIITCWKFQYIISIIILGSYIYICLATYNSNFQYFKIKSLVPFGLQIYRFNCKSIIFDITNLIWKSKGGSLNEYFGTLSSGKWEP